MASGPFKQCFICNNNSESAPKKLFLSVPKNEKTRLLWCKALNLDIQSLRNAKRYCCEDHFDLEADSVNWMRFKMMGKYLTLKPDVVPHKCLTPSKQKMSSESQMTSSEKKRKLEMMKQVDEKKSRRVLFHTSQKRRIADTDYDDDAGLEAINYEAPATAVSTSSNILSVEGLSSPSGTLHVDQWTSESRKGTLFKHKPHLRSVGINATVEMKSKATGTPRSTDDQHQQLHTSVDEISSASLVSASKNSEDYVPSVTSTGSSSSQSSVEESNKRGDVTSHIRLLERRSKFYLGLPADAYFIVKLCSTKGNIPVLHILVTLKKIRLDDQYSRLADDFHISTSYVGKIFTKTVPLLASLLQQLIFWPSPTQTRRLLPISFRSRYSNVRGIVDCFEIEIEKPSNPTKQSMTWSSYYQANTIKYLICATPNGIVTFVSCGFGGRTSDKIIIEESGFLTSLPNDASIMADRGFKHISHHLAAKGCTLVRPPSVATDQKLSKSEVKVGKQIAAIRIHIERVIGRLREFKLLTPHSCIDHNLLYLMDCVIVIVGAILNVQSKLIK